MSLPVSPARPATAALPDGLPSSWTVRPLETVDAAAVAGLLTAEERAHPADFHVDADEVTETFTSPMVDLANGTVGVFDGPELVAYGVVQVVTPSGSAARTWMAYLDGAVHPDHERRGLGRWIVDESVRSARALRDATAPTLVGEVKIGLPVERPGVAALVADRGFEVWRWFTEMRVELDDATARPAVPDVPGHVVRPYRSADEDAVRLVSNEAFGDHWGSVPMDAETWRSRYPGSATFRPDVSVVATTDDGRIVGFVLVAEYDAETVERGFRTAYLSRIGTARAHRGLGLASLMVQRVLPILAAAGYRRADLDVDSDSPTGAGRIYARVGFGPVKQHSVAGLRLPPTDS
ncbi:GNAT family N-acetyltransferase [Nakamurella flavida]|uniref:GNAT family N-acetyltransferase n=1 Tax=Nakamurella flavida TaxID=363630 RepID=A0A938YH83_9ACTN|nr:GNAT family N-acetyltransferase [Nakamurella flavida]MBM9475029.1 GNAT family N-acetyltransferase [Nakamurella flavida]MDP9776598.1 ribosomal protein S18 acetylase RimI-like enzyme [Nakamurella flavida]